MLQDNLQTRSYSRDVVRNNYMFQGKIVLDVETFHDLKVVCWLSYSQLRDMRPFLKSRGVILPPETEISNRESELTLGNYMVVIEEFEETKKVETIEGNKYKKIEKMEKHLGIINNLQKSTLSVCA